MGVIIFNDIIYESILFSTIRYLYEIEFKKKNSYILFNFIHNLIFILFSFFRLLFDYADLPHGPISIEL